MRGQKTDELAALRAGWGRKTERSVSLSSVFSNLCLLTLKSLSSDPDPQISVF
ncbi:MAG: hypothetical protein LBD06_13180 [Candidatus Accumulibacter sp.]|nr:hypothetical protein [Accumulibacter sp.]